MGSLPTFLLLGAQRAGTTWIHESLAQLPQVTVPRHTKEVHFFDRHYSRGTDWYRSFFHQSFSSSSGLAVGESTPSYLFDPRVPARICGTIPGARLVAVLRNPIDRAYSHYGLHVRRYGEHGSFRRFLSKCPEAVARGLYADQLERYLALFSREQLLVVKFEDLVRDPFGGLAAIAHHIGAGLVDLERVSPPFRNRSGHSALNPRFAALAGQTAQGLRSLGCHRLVDVVKRNRVVRHLDRVGRPLDSISKQDGEALRELYQGPNRRLVQLLGERFQWEGNS